MSASPVSGVHFTVRRLSCTFLIILLAVPSAGALKFTAHAAHSISSTTRDNHLSDGVGDSFPASAQVFEKIPGISEFVGVGTGKIEIVRLLGVLMKPGHYLTEPMQFYRHNDGKYAYKNFNAPGIEATESWDAENSIIDTKQETIRANTNNNTYPTQYRNWFESWQCFAAADLSEFKKDPRFMVSDFIPVISQMWIEWHRKWWPKLKEEVFTTTDNTWMKGNYGTKEKMDSTLRRALKEAADERAKSPTSPKDDPTDVVKKIVLIFDMHGTADINDPASGWAFFDESGYGRAKAAFRPQDVSNMIISMLELRKEATEILVILSYCGAGNGYDKLSSEVKSNPRVKIMSASCNGRRHTNADTSPLLTYVTVDDKRTLPEDMKTRWINNNPSSETSDAPKHYDVWAGYESWLAMNMLFEGIDPWEINNRDWTSRYLPRIFWEHGGGPLSLTMTYGEQLQLREEKYRAGGLLGEPSFFNDHTRGLFSGTLSTRHINPAKGIGPFNLTKVHSNAHNFNEQLEVEDMRKKYPLTTCKDGSCYFNGEHWKGWRLLDIAEKVAPPQIQNLGDWNYQRIHRSRKKLEKRKQPVLCDPNGSVGGCTYTHQEPAVAASRAHEFGLRYKKVTAYINNEPARDDRSVLHEYNGGEYMISKTLVDKLTMPDNYMPPKVHLLVWSVADETMAKHGVDAFSFSATNYDDMLDYTYLFQRDHDDLNDTEKTRSEWKQYFKKNYTAVRSKLHQTLCEENKFNEAFPEGAVTFTEESFKKAFDCLVKANVLKRNLENKTREEDVARENLKKRLFKAMNSQDFKEKRFVDFHNDMYFGGKIDPELRKNPTSLKDKTPFVWNTKDALAVLRALQETNELHYAPLYSVLIRVEYDLEDPANQEFHFNQQWKKLTRRGNNLTKNDSEHGWKRQEFVEYVGSVVRFQRELQNAMKDMEERKELEFIKSYEQHKEKFSVLEKEINEERRKLEEASHPAISQEKNQSTRKPQNVVEAEIFKTLDELLQFMKPVEAMDRFGCRQWPTEIEEMEHVEKYDLLLLLREAIELATFIKTMKQDKSMDEKFMDLAWQRAFELSSKLKMSTVVSLVDALKVEVKIEFLSEYQGFGEGADIGPYVTGKIASLDDKGKRLMTKLFMDNKDQIIQDAKAITGRCDIGERPNGVDVDMSGQPVKNSKRNFAGEFVRIPDIDKFDCSTLENKHSCSTQQGCTWISLKDTLALESKKDWQEAVDAPKVLTQMSIEGRIRALNHLDAEDKWENTCEVNSDCDEGEMCSNHVCVPEPSDEMIRVTHDTLHSANQGCQHDDGICGVKVMLYKSEEPLLQVGQDKSIRRLRRGKTETVEQFDVPMNNESIDDESMDDDSIDKVDTDMVDTTKISQGIELGCYFDDGCKKKKRRCGQEKEAKLGCYFDDGCKKKKRRCGQEKEAKSGCHFNETCEETDGWIVTKADKRRCGQETKAKYTRSKKAQQTGGAQQHGDQHVVRNSAMPPQCNNADAPMCEDDLTVGREGNTECDKNMLLDDVPNGTACTDEKAKATCCNACL